MSARIGGWLILSAVLSVLVLVTARAFIVLDARWLIVSFWVAAIGIALEHFGRRT